MLGLPKTRKQFAALMGPLTFLLMDLILPEIGGFTDGQNVVIAMASWMVIWWITEVVDLAVTALIPLVILPLFGVVSPIDTASAYGNRIIFLFLGGFVLALGIEKSQLHRRIALGLIAITGIRANRIILGFMLATAFLSMWLSNTATTVMMLPIAISIIELVRESVHEERAKLPLKNFGLGLLIAIAYGANIGGTATIIGTPPNAVMASFVSQLYNVEVGFGEWMLAVLPFTLVFLWITWVMITRVLLPNRLGELEEVQSALKDQLQKLGRLSKHEITALVIFLFTAVLWIIRKPLANHVELFSNLDDAGIAIVGAILMFVIPSGNTEERTPILHWTDTSKLPWGILLLFGGGIALALGMQASGLIELLGEQFVQFKEWPVILIILILVVIMIYATELMSNVALTSILIPVVLVFAESINVSLMQLAIPVTLAASCAFMLPISTPPNAIVFSGGGMKIKDMMRAGFWINIIAVVLILIFSQWFSYVFRNAM